jgi:hypothetical protein
MKSSKFWTATLCLGLMTVMGGSRLWAGERSQAAELKAKMVAEGWTAIEEGVFERHRGANKVEHLGYGKEGLAWTIGELNRQLAEMRQEYQGYPSEDLAKIIDQLSIKIGNAKRELRNMAGMSSLTAGLAGASCSICYSATADAYPLTTVQGVGAIADAAFNSSCGYSGDTYAYAYARATLNGTTTTHSQSDPHTGTSVTSHAAATVNGGGTDCTSNANSYAQSTALGISYTTSDTNNSCPPVTPPASLTVSISGPAFPTALGSCKNITWTSTVSGGTTPYTYLWNVGGFTHTTASVTRQFCGSQTINVSLTVTDSTNPTHSTGSATFVTELETDIGGGCNPICQ